MTSCCVPLERPVAFWEVQEAMNIDYLEVKVPTRTAHWNDEAFIQIAPVSRTPKYYATSTK